MPHVLLILRVSGQVPGEKALFVDESPYNAGTITTMAAIPQ